MLKRMLRSQDRTLNQPSSPHPRRSRAVCLFSPRTIALAMRDASLEKSLQLASPAPNIIPQPYESKHFVPWHNSRIALLYPASPIDGPCAHPRHPGLEDNFHAKSGSAIPAWANLSWRALRLGEQFHSAGLPAPHLPGLTPQRESRRLPCPPLSKPWPARHTLATPRMQNRFRVGWVRLANSAQRSQFPCVRPLSARRNPKAQGTCYYAT